MTTTKKCAVILIGNFCIGPTQRFEVGMTKPIDNFAEKAMQKKLGDPDSTKMSQSKLLSLSWRHAKRS